MQKRNLWFGAMAVVCLSAGSVLFGQGDEPVETDHEVQEQKEGQSEPESQVKEKKPQEPKNFLATYEEKLEAPAIKFVAGAAGKVRRAVEDATVNGTLKNLWQGHKKYRILVPALVLTNVAEYFWARGKEKKGFGDYCKFNIPFKEWRSKIFSTGIGAWMLYLLSHENVAGPEAPAAEDAAEGEASEG